MYRLLALDMDGTLLTDDKIITEEVQHALVKVAKKNINITIATGRFPASAWLHGKLLNLKVPLIALNGAVILDAGSGEEIESNPLPIETIKRIVKFAEENNVYVHFHGYNTLYVKEINDINKNWAIANVVVDENKELIKENYEEQLSFFKIREVENYMKFLEKRDIPAFYKATIINDNPALVEELYKEISDWADLSVTRTGKRRFDINKAGVSKKSALVSLCKKIQISNEDVVAVGDYDNDAEMIKWAGLGIAMENGNDYIKSIADAITLSNEDAGVAHVIKEYFKAI